MNIKILGIVGGFVVAGLSGVGGAALMRSTAHGPTDEPKQAETKPSKDDVEDFYKTFRFCFQDTANGPQIGPNKPFCPQEFAQKANDICGSSEKLQQHIDVLDNQASKLILAIGCTRWQKAQGNLKDIQGAVKIISQAPNVPKGFYVYPTDTGPNVSCIADALTFIDQDTRGTIIACDSFSADKNVKPFQGSVQVPPKSGPQPSTTINANGPR